MTVQPERGDRATLSGVEPDVGLGALWLLSLYAALLLLVPSPWVLGAVGSAGTPASLLALAGGYGWFWGRIYRRGSWTAFSQPVRNASLVLFLVLLAVYANSMLGPIEPASVSAADNGMLRAAAWVGIVVVANDGIRDLDAVRTLLRRLTVLAALVAGLALLQFASRDLIIDRLSVPGLTLNSAVLGLAERNGLSRAPGTALSPIELGVVLAMVLPAAATFALSGRRPLLSWLAVGTMSLAIFLSISRAALLAALVAVVCMLPVWSRRVRWAAAGFGLATFAFVYVSVPGLLGAFGSLFLGISTDPSALSRTDSYEAAGVFFARHPLMGRGFGTFVPEYRILDNQWLLLAIETGLLGITTFSAVLGLAVVVARRARLVLALEVDQQLAQSLLAGTVAGASGMFFFDALSFPMAAGVLFLMVGLSGAVWHAARLAAQGEDHVVQH